MKGNLRFQTQARVSSVFKGADVLKGADLVSPLEGSWGVFLDKTKLKTTQKSLKVKEAEFG